METKKIFSEYNFCLINFYYILKKCEMDLINDLHAYNLLKDGKVCRDTKKLFLHFLTLSICNYILKHKNREKNIIYYNTKIPVDSNLLKYYKEQDLEKLFTVIVDKLKKNLPVRFYTGKITFKEILLNKNGYYEEFIANIKQLLEKHDLALFTFNKTLLFAKRHGLLFLNREYFNSIKTKQLLMG